ncbi:hypothetical protein BHF71_00810 [Vulcanibacillus modesticaldus]|uniref:Diguanylate cyclase n=2 Tax=Vulcanibacillus modesticaldus TaxID=337097 RepID=A0A1D2YY35_9BACI|nr:hypothetical protein BHF71_00810 [Vulcanibacillus modesticaldus]
MLKDEKLDFYQSSDQLSLNFPKMINVGVSVQIFAIFVSTSKQPKFQQAIKSIDTFYEKIIKKADKIQLATTYFQLEEILKAKKIAGLLSLEGAEALEGDLSKLRILHKLGVKIIGLTWNHANEVADGIMEPRGGGLTTFGKMVIDEMNRLNMIVDVSHLSEKGFWDVVEITRKPIIASHSNTRKFCNHPRNLTDKQIKAIIESGGMIGITFVKNFVANKDHATIDDLILHIEHIAELGGISNVGLGSDFDGATTLSELQDARDLDNLANNLHKKFPSHIVRAILGDNWLNYFKRAL